ncbi:MAG TPA: sigma-70 family RNA polymerase sigma factor [Verrucomicrobiae bacterium]|nr:sigma-70 family RNA polymerase sigma factor [Verrucomicrobiae bacterium]
MSPPEAPRDDLRTEAATFRTTHWTVVLAAKEGKGSAAEAVAALCSSYWYPIYAFIRRTGASPHEAEDLTQEFFCRVLQREWLGNVHPAGGKFRSFLLRCVKNFLANERDKVLAQRRGGGRAPVPLEREDAETRYMFEPADPITPDMVYERQWVFELLERTVESLRSEYAKTNKLDWFEQLRGFLPGGREELSRAEMAQKRGLSANAIDVAIHRLRQRFGAVLRQKVAETVSCEAEVDEEIRHLMSVLSA